MSEQDNIEFEYARPGSEVFMDAPAIRRGMHLPSGVIWGFIACGLLGLAVGAIFGLGLIDNVINSQKRYEEGLQQAINSGATVSRPVLNDLVELDNDGIRSSFREAGYQLIDVEALYADENEYDENSLDLVKVPDGMDYQKTEELFTSSMRRADVTDVAQYLATSWRFSSYNADGIDLKVKYADFQSKTIEEAIMNAITAQGWQDSNFGETGVDSSGNTYQNGTISINDINLHWTVSVCPLSDVYDISALPDESFYVGARLVQ